VYLGLNKLTQICIIETAKKLEGLDSQIVKVDTDHITIIAFRVLTKSSLDLIRT